MLQTVSPLLPELALLFMTAAATHLVMSFAQTLMHYKLGKAGCWTDSGECPTEDTDPGWRPCNNR